MFQGVHMHKTIILQKCNPDKWYEMLTYLFTDNKKDLTVLIVFKRAVSRFISNEIHVTSTKHKGTSNQKRV